MSGLQQVIDALDGISVQSLRQDALTLAALNEWALEHLGIDYRAGDRVKIVHPIPCDNGWKAYRECLVVGATGVVNKVEFTPYGKRWLASFTPDRDWSVGDPFGNEGVRRYWNGRFEDTPEGMRPPDEYDREHHPDGRRHVFYFDVAWLVKA